jgi:hypothetical protein
VAKTILAGKNVKEFALEKVLTILTFIGAILARLAEDFFLRHRPGDRARDYSENENPKNLFRNRHIFERKGWQAKTLASLFYN